MAINTETIMPIGMNRDSLIGTGNSDKYSFENLNLRYIASEDGTTGSWTTERSTKKEAVLSMGTNVLGQAVINDTLVLFIHNEHDFILKVYYINDVIHTNILYEGNLNFSNKIETTVSYENENIQKVYWVDGINPLRMINIAKVKAASNFDTQFDVIPELSLNEQVTIDKTYNGSGMFPSGTTQYFFTYVDKYGRESNIFYASSLYYNSLKDRGLNPDGSEYASCSYAIHINNLDTINMFDYVRIYSVIRPLEGATPVARIVVDLDLNNADNTKEDSIFYIDTNTTGELIDYTTILFLGGKPIIPSTIEQKNNTLFLGNLRLKKSYIITSKFKEALKNSTSVVFENETKLNTDTFFTDLDYPFNKSLDLNADYITTFKTGITYRFAIQFQDIYGNWTEAIYLGDVLNDAKNSTSNRVVAKATINLPALYSSYNNILRNFKKARLLCTYPGIADKEIVAQGVLCPTMFHPAWEKVHAPDRFSSWFFRPEKGNSPASGPSITEFNAQDTIEVTGDYSLKIEVNSSSVNWDNYTTNQEALLKVTPSYKNFAKNDITKLVTVSYTSGTTTKEIVDGGSIESSFEYVQANIDFVDLSTVSQNSNTMYCIRLYKYNPTALYFRSIIVSTVVNGNTVTIPRVISSNSNKNHTSATITSYIIEDNNIQLPCFKLYYGVDNPFIDIIDDTIPTQGTVFYNREISYKCFVSNEYKSTANPPYINIQFYDYNEGIGVVTDLGTIFQGYVRNSYYYYDGSVEGGYGWDSKGRVTNEVQSADSPIFNDYKNHLNDPGHLEDWGFYIDKEKYFTLHSPDIEYNESLHTSNIQECKLRIIGQVNQTAWATDMEVDADVGIDYIGNKGTGLVKNTQNNRYRYSLFGQVYDVNTKTAFWKDIDVYASNSAKKTRNRKQIDYYQYEYNIYPFHRKFLNNYVRDVDIIISGEGESEVTITKSSEIKYKSLSVYRVFGVNDLYDNPTETASNVGAQIFNTNSYTPINIKLNNTTIKYNGTIDDIAEPFVSANNGDDYSTSAVYKFDGLYNGNYTKNYKVFKTDTVESNADVQTSDILIKFKGAYPILANGINKRISYDSVDSVGYLSVDSEGPQIRFKSTTHAVLNLEELTTNDKWPKKQLVHPSLYLAELTKTVSNRYGGTSSTALKNNVFYPCGMPVNMPYDISENPITVKGTRGDCYFMAYDCLKTYPYSNEERNGIIEIASFNCESYINLNGRYDQYIGKMDGITNLDKTKFGLINLGYTQNKDLFSYHIIDDDDSNLANYPNQITWTKTKTPSEIVDTWTNITLANIANAEGTMGSITALSMYNDNLIMFQEHGVARLGYNEKTAISTENGIPLEIASSNKFTGFAYLSKEIGCQNKWTINISKNGLMFIDTSRKELNLVGETIIPISTKQGFDSFFINELDRDANFTTYYDKVSKDIYYLNSRCCLAFNEVSGTFTSFYSYEGITALATINNHSIAAKNGFIWALREGSDYSNYFDNIRPYRMIVCCDGNKYFQMDKVFNTVETRSDIFNPDSLGSSVDKNPFDTISAWNSYQKPKDFPLDGTDILYEWPASRKYNIWRYVIPRATYDDESITFDRIRNTFAFIKVERKLPDGNRAIIHDMVIYYDIK